MVEIETKVLTDTLAELAIIENAQIGAISESCSFALQTTGGSSDETFFSGSSIGHISIKLLCQDQSENAYNRLCKAVNLLTGLRNFNRTGYQMLYYTPQSKPQFASFEKTNSTAVYTAVVLAYYYTGG